MSPELAEWLSRSGLMYSNTPMRAAFRVILERLEQLDDGLVHALNTALQKENAAPCHPGWITTSKTDHEQIVRDMAAEFLGQEGDGI